MPAAGQDATAPRSGGLPPPPRRGLWWITAIAALALAALHFTLLLAWLIPSEAAPGLRRAAQVYVAPVFAQNWWLFAPDPPAVDRRVDVRGTWVQDGEHRSTPWLPLIDPLTAAVQANPFTPRNATWIVVLNATYSLSDPMGPLRLHGGARDLILRGWSDPARQPPALVVLERAGALALAAAYPDRDLEQVQVRLTVRPLPSFADRAAPASAPADELLFPPVPYAMDLPVRSAGR